MLLTPREIAKLYAEARDICQDLREARDASSEGGETITKAERRRIVRKALRFVGHVGRDLLD